MVAYSIQRTLSAKEDQKRALWILHGRGQYLRTSTFSPTTDQTHIHHTSHIPHHQQDNIPTT